ncbi:hypothetical protein HY405_01190 [Candidatus Microgenomates bacterium]|nr:hypothetical protein [Candidatus Microgenomates bacterium]
MEETETQVPVEGEGKKAYLVAAGIALVVIILVGGYFFMKSRQTPSPSPAQEATSPTVSVKEVTVALGELGKSGESGTAILREEAGKLTVTLDLTGAPKGVKQPAHIHKGTCPGVGAVLYPLNFPVDGQSVTSLDITLDSLSPQLPLAINVHKSESQSNVYVACGDIKIE